MNQSWLCAVGFAVCAADHDMILHTLWQFRLDSLFQHCLLRVPPKCIILHHELHTTVLRYGYILERFYFVHASQCGCVHMWPYDSGSLSGFKCRDLLIRASSGTCFWNPPSSTVCIMRALTHLGRHAGLLYSKGSIVMVHCGGALWTGTAICIVTSTAICMLHQFTYKHNCACHTSSACQHVKE